MKTSFWLTAPVYIIMGKAWHLENEAAGHSVPAAWKQREMTSVAGVAFF